MARKIKIAATSDWHGTLPEIPKCDLLLIAGDIVPKEDQDSLRRSLMWFEGTFIPHIKKAKCNKCIFTAGNHDFFLTTEMFSYINAIIAYHGLSKKIIYLLDETYEYRGLKIYGCPWTASPSGWAFYASFPDWVYKNIPEGLDILLCHQAPNVENIGTSNFGTQKEKEWGSPDLTCNIARAKPRLVFCGHIHSGNHEPVRFGETTIYNVSLKNEMYLPTYPITVISVEPGPTIYQKN